MSVLSHGSTLPSAQPPRANKPTDMLPNMRDVAALIADDARENLAGVDVISIGPLYADEPAPGGTRYSVVAIGPTGPERTVCRI
jgi:hypothetical protein